MATSFQFAVATHIMTGLGFYHGRQVTSQEMASTVNANPSFIRKTLSKLAKAGLLTTSRGKGGSCALASAPEDITLKDIYLASEAPAPFAIHTYPVQKTCPISSNIKPCLSAIQLATDLKLQEALASVTLASLVADVRKRSKVRKA